MIGKLQAMHVLVIEVIAENSEVERAAWRFPESREQAEDYWYYIRALAESGQFRRDRGEHVQVVSARLYEVDAADRAAAKDAVIAGRGTILKDTEDALAGLSDYEKSLESLLGVPLKSKNSN